MRFLPTMVVVLAMAASPVPVAGAGPASPGGRSTPELIERAVRRGDVGRSRADLFLAYALAAPTRLPARFRSAVPWDGTLPLLRLRQRLDTGPRTADREAASQLLAAGSTSCSNGSSGSLPSETTSDHFWIQYASPSGGLTIGDYRSALDTSWDTEVDLFGWAPPPIKSGTPHGKYHVRVQDGLTAGLYGFVSASGTYAGDVGDNPATSWNEGDARASCMVLRDNYTGLPSSPLDSLRSTVAHEFNHSIQYGYGALTGANAVDDHLVEGTSMWMEDEVFDDADDSHHWLWPDFTDSLGSYEEHLPPLDRNPYPYWVLLRALTERYGSGDGGGAEKVMQDFWESTSQSSTSNMFPALASSLEAKGTTLGDAYHAAAITLILNLACDDAGYVYPYCLEEGPGYVDASGAVDSHGAILSVGETLSSTVEDDYALRWIQLPTGGAPFSLTLRNQDVSGGQLRGSVICDTGTALLPLAFPSVLGPASEEGVGAFDPSGCTAAFVVITNQSETDANPTLSVARSFELSTSATNEMATLSVSQVGNLSGLVTADQGGLECGTMCSANYPLNAQVELTPHPPDGIGFSWGGACQGSSSCELTMDGAKAVTASFTDSDPPSPASIDVLGGAFQTERVIEGAWSSNGAATFDVRYRRARWNGGFGSHSTWANDTALNKGMQPGSAGFTYCLSARGRDDLGNLTAWSEEACTAIPINDRGLTRRGRWALRTNGSAYLGTFSKAKKRGSKLILRDVRARRLALVATTCPRCGRVKIIMDGEVVKKASLRSSTTRKRRVILGPRFDHLETGTVKVVVLSRGRPVKIEGLGISQA